MNLRDYQQAAVDAIAQAFVLNGKRRLLMVLPTASGKTVIFSELPKYFDGQVLVLAHRKELIAQAAAKLLAANPGLHVAVEMADQRARSDAHVIVASIQTLANPKRRAKFLGSDFSLVIVDEAHHCAKDNTYDKVLRDLGCFSPDGPCLLGVTATPYRTAGATLGAFFDDVAYERTLLSMIEEGWVSPLRAYSVRTHTSLEGIGTRGGDFKEGELSERVNNEKRNLEIVRAWEKIGLDSRHSTLAFAVDVAHARALTVAFKAAGHAAEEVFGDTPSAHRSDVFRRFLNRETKILVNVAVATEGTDLPPVDCILLGRPTKSPLLVTQMVGRGLRLYPGKADCLIIDMVDTCSRHKIATSATVLGLPANVNAKGGDLRVFKAKLDALQKDFPRISLTTVPEITEEWIEHQRQRMKELMERSSTTVRATEVNLFGGSTRAPTAEQKWEGPPTSRQAWRLKRLGYDPDRVSFRQAWMIIRRAEAQG